MAIERADETTFELILQIFPNEVLSWSMSIEVPTERQPSSSLDSLSSLARLRTGKESEPVSTPIRVAINGFGRIGRLSLRRAADNPNLDIVAINNHNTDTQVQAHLFKYDSRYGRYSGEVGSDSDSIFVDGKRIHSFSEDDPSRLPWGDLGVDLVIESTGSFSDGVKARAHMEAGAKKVLITTSAVNEDIEIVLGLNEEQYDEPSHRIISNSSCSTNCASHLINVLGTGNIESGTVTIVHAPTGDQNHVDGVHRDLRRARAAGINIIPTTSGLEKSLDKLFPTLRGKFGVLSVRVPTDGASMAEVRAKMAEPVSVNEINEKFERAEQGKLLGIMGAIREPLVGIDFKGDLRSAVVDIGLTTVTAERMVSVKAWFDNEMAYAQRVVDLAELIARSSQANSNG